MVAKTILLYGKRKGKTSHTAETIAFNLSLNYNIKVDKINVRDYRNKTTNLNDYDAVIIGSSIVSDRWVKKCLKILKKLPAEECKLFIYVTAGATMNKVREHGLEKSEAIREGVEKYIDRYTAKYNLKPDSKMVFGSRTIKRGKLKYDNWNKDDIKKWANEIGQIIVATH